MCHYLCVFCNIAMLQVVSQIPRQCITVATGKNIIMLKSLLLLCSNNKSRFGMDARWMCAHGCALSPKANLSALFLCSLVSCTFLQPMKVHTHCHFMLPAEFLLSLVCNATNPECTFPVFASWSLCEQIDNLYNLRTYANICSIAMLSTKKSGNKKGTEGKELKGEMEKHLKTFIN